MKHYQFRLRQFNAFKNQNIQNGNFDVIFQFEGDQMLYAHKLMLSTASDVLDVMISERWTNENEPIKIEHFSFEDFKELINFIYFFDFKITDENIHSMVDIAEFYNIPEMKFFCEEYLLKLNITLENVLQVYEFAKKYSLSNDLIFLTKSIMKENYLELLNSNEILDIKSQTFQEFIALPESLLLQEKIFETACKWAENQAAIKKKSYENQTTFDSQAAIKEAITEILPKIHFEQMSRDFLIQFVVPNGLLFSAEQLQELSNILYSSTRLKLHVKVTNLKGQILIGKITGDLKNLKNLKTINETIISLKNQKTDGYYWKTKLSHPSEPSNVKKDDKVKYYLLIDKDGDLAIKDLSKLRFEDYLLTAMTPNGDRYHMASGSKIEAELNF